MKNESISKARLPVFPPARAQTRLWSGIASHGAADLSVTRACLRMNVNGRAGGKSGRIDLEDTNRNPVLNEEYGTLRRPL